MTQLTDVRETQAVSLPSFPDVKIEMYTSLLTYQVEQIRKFTDDFTAGIETIKMLIKSWTFTDDNEKTLAITTDNLKKLPSDDFMSLLAVVTKAAKANEVKKN